MGGLCSWASRAGFLPLGLTGVSWVPKCNHKCAPLDADWWHVHLCDRSSKREVRVYDTETVQLLATQELDVSPAILDVHYDESTSLAFLAAKVFQHFRLDYDRTRATN